MPLVWYLDPQCEKTNGCFIAIFLYVGSHILAPTTKVRNVSSDRILIQFECCFFYCKSHFNFQFKNNLLTLITTKTAKKRKKRKKKGKERTSKDIIAGNGRIIKA